VATSQDTASWTGSVDGPTLAIGNFNEGSYSQLIEGDRGFTCYVWDTGPGATVISEPAGISGAFEGDKVFRVDVGELGWSGIGFTTTISPAV